MTLDNRSHSFTTMITLRKSEIPLYLQDGELYATLMEDNEDPHEEVTFPTNVLKPDTSVNSVEDCDRLLDSLRFWGVVGLIPEQLVSYVLSHDGVSDVLEKYKKEFKYIYWLRRIVWSYRADRMRNAIQSGMIELVRPLAELEHLFPKDACDLAAENGKLDVFLCLLEHGCTWQKRTSFLAAKHGWIDILTCMCEHGNTVDEEDLRVAVYGGHLDCIKYVLTQCRSHQFFHHIVVNTASKSGHLHVLQYLAEKNMDWSHFFCGYAAQRGHLPCLKFMHEHGCQWTANIMELAAQNGHLHCMQYMHENSCPWSTAVTRSAKQSGHGECLAYALSHGCPESPGSEYTDTSGGWLY